MPKISNLYHLSQLDTELATSTIMRMCKLHDGRTRDMAKALQVSYPTLMRILEMLGLKQVVRAVRFKKPPSPDVNDAYTGNTLEA